MKKTRQKTSKRSVSPIELEVIPFDGGFALSLDGEVLCTDDGTPVKHPVAPLLEHMLSEFDGQGHIKIDSQKIKGPKYFGSFALFRVQKKFIESRKDELSTTFAERLLGDPTLHPSAGPEQTDQYARYGPLLEWLGDRLGELQKLAAGIPHWLGEDEFMNREETMSQAKHSQYVVSLHDEYVALLPEERCVAMYLHALHDGHVLFPLALALRKCSVEEYAMGVMAGQAILTGVFGDVNDKAHRQVFEKLRADARTALEYIRCYQNGTPSQRLKEMTTAGESAQQEFKSTLRWNLRSGRADEAITHACVKTVAAFLNSEGGRLLIGVADDGSIVGVGQDGFDNSDKFQLHLFNVLKQSLGETAATSVAIELLPHTQTITVCLVTCLASADPVYCRLKNGEEHFYVRTGPGTSELPPSELVPYVARRFHTREASTKKTK